VLPLFESGIPLLRERLKQLPDADNIIIAYPDEGAWKRFKYQFGDYQEVGRADSKSSHVPCISLQQASAATDSHRAC
jgi:hypothetical protein